MSPHDAPRSAPPDNAEPCLVEGGTLAVDGLELQVRLSARRKRLGLTVERDGSLTLRAPLECESGRAVAFVRESRGWIADKLRLSEGRRQLHPLRTLHDGEIHRYLGRDYRLLLVNEDDHGSGPDAASVRLTAGRLRLDRAVAADSRSARHALAAWYSKVGERWANGRLQPWAARMDVPEPRLEVRDLGHRWGTYRRHQDSDRHQGRVALHWATFQLPTHLIDYVIAHELAHIRVAGHGRDYWRLLSRALPECRQLKTELDELGRRVWMGDVDESAD